MLQWNDPLDSDDNQIDAARALAQVTQWSGTWAAGSTPDGCVFVNLDSDQFVIERAVRAA